MDRIPFDQISIGRSRHFYCSCFLSCGHRFTSRAAGTDLLGANALCARSLFADTLLFSASARPFFRSRSRLRLTDWSSAGRRSLMKAAAGFFRPVRSYPSEPFWRSAIAERNCSALARNFCVAAACFVAANVAFLSTNLNIYGSRASNTQWLRVTSLPPSKPFAHPI